MIDTRRVKNRPKLTFDTPTHAIAHARQLVDLERAGRLETLGNWSLGQAMGHLAWWANGMYDGFPAQVRPPAPIRWMGRLFRGAFLARAMPVGVRIPKSPGGTYGTEPMSTDAGFDAFRRAFERVESTPPVHPSPLLGALTHDQSRLLQRRHAELHLSFFRENRPA